MPGMGLSAPGPMLQPGYESTPELCCYWDRNNYIVDEYAAALSRK